MNPPPWVSALMGATLLTWGLVDETGIVRATLVVFGLLYLLASFATTKAAMRDEEPETHRAVFVPRVHGDPVGYNLDDTFYCADCMTELMGFDYPDEVIEAINAELEVGTGREIPVPIYHGSAIARVFDCAVCSRNLERSNV